MAAVHKRASAKRNLIEDYVYLAEATGLDVAERFLHAAEESFHELARYPEMGASLALSSPVLTGLRKWRQRVRETPHFYLPTAKDVSIVRVLHAAQDWWGLLGVS